MRRRFARRVVVAAVGLVGLLAGSAHAEEITLITGDRVTYTRAADGREQVSVRPAPRRDGTPVHFVSRSDASGYYVVPSDARPRIDAGTLDRALFDVRDLAAAARRDPGLRVIAAYEGDPSAARLMRAADALPASETAVALPTLDSAALRVEPDRAPDFWAALDGSATVRLARGVRKLWLDGTARATLADSVPQVGAPAVWQAGYDGDGVPVAVLDTGADATHPDLAGKISASRNFTPEPSADDGNGHGTHVAATVAGSGAAPGARRGVAPGAEILSGKVLNSGGSGSFSWILSGMEWAVQSGARVVNMSLSAGPTDGTDVLSQAVNSYTAQSGVLFVISAGNLGPGASTVATPGAADAALTVGAVDRMASFSSRGPRRGDAAPKPEITAPGVGIVAARAAGTHLGPDVGEHHTMLNGTSMAAPHVAGAAALLAQAHPGWRAEELKSALVGSATDVGASGFAQGAGRLDAARAFRQAVRAEPAAVSFGSFPWPQGGAPPALRTITYRNDGTAPLELALSVGARDLVGAPAASGALTLSESTITVPAGGSRSVTLTLDPAVGEVGAFAGQVVATGGDVVVRTPLGYHKAVRSQRVTFRVTGSRGQPAGGGFQAVRIDGPLSPDPFVDTVFDIYPSGGVATADLPAGRYDIAGEIIERGLTSDVTTLAVEPDVDLTEADAAFEVDARRGVPLRPRTDEPTHPFAMTAGSVWKLGERAAYLRSFSSGHDPDTQLRGIPARAPAAPGRYTFETTFTLAPPMVSLRVRHGGGEPMYPVYHWGAPQTVERLDGRFRLPLAAVGDGGADDFAGRDLAGKVALVALQPPAGNPYGYLFAQSEAAIRNAKAAGVAALLFYVDVPGADTWQPNPVLGVRLPVLSLLYEDGRRLAERLARRPVELDIDAKAALEETYHLHYDHPRGIPATPPALVRRSRLATVPMDLHGDGPDQLYYLAFSARGDLPTSGPFFTTGVWGPAEHTAYIGPVTSGLQWHRAMFLSPGGELIAHSMETDDRFARSGRAPRESWFEGPFVPAAYELPPELRGGLFPVLCGFCREGDRLLPTGYDGDDEPRHATLAQPWNHQVRLFAGETELELRPLSEDFFGIGYFQLPVQAATYRLEDRSVDPRGGGREVRTTWTFRSAGQTAPSTVPADTFCVLSGLTLDASCRHEPLISVRYRLGTGLDNAVRGGGVHAFEVTAGHHSQAGGAPIARVAVEVSTDDGATWRHAPSWPRGGGRVTALAFQPRSGHVSIRVKAWDRAGNRVQQEVIRAYRLRT
jgi:subtilisin family serine protease